MHVRMCIVVSEQWPKQEVTRMPIGGLVYYAKGLDFYPERWWGGVGGPLTGFQRMNDITSRCSLAQFGEALGRARLAESEPSGSVFNRPRKQIHWQRE